MSSITPYKTSKGRRWRVQYRDPDGTLRGKRGFRTKSEAEAWATDNSSAINNRTWVNPTDLQTPINDLAPTWISGLTRLTPSGARVMKIAWKTHVQPYWGLRAIGEIQPSHIQNWINTQTLGASSIRRNHSCLSQILDIAVNDGILPKNPARGLKLPRKPAPKQIMLSAHQLETLASECSKHQSLVWVLGTVGLRWAEAAGLQCRDINVLRNRLSIERAAVTVANKIEWGEVKTHEARTVAVAPDVMRLLIKEMEGKAPTDLVWSDDSGNPLRSPTTGTWFNLAVNRCCERDPHFPRVTPHDLRHTAASLLVAAGANVKVVQRQLGHASAAMTLDTYTSLFDADLDAVAESMKTILKTTQIASI